MTRASLLAASLVALVFPGGTVATADDSPAETLRRPVALALSADDSRLWVANRGAGTVTEIEVPAGRVRGEYAAGTTPVALAPMTKERLAVVDFAEHAVHLFRVGSDGLARLGSTKVARHPVSAAWDGERHRLYVASLWSRRLTMLTFDGQQFRREQFLDLPLAPRRLLLLDGGRRLLVGDAFGGGVLVVDPLRPKVLGERRLFSHNIRSLASTPDEKMVVVAAQMLNEHAHTIRNDVHWGLLMANDLRWLKTERLLKPGDNLFDGSHLHPLGGPGSAAADPSDAVVAPSGLVVVALGGVGQVAIGREDDFSFTRLRVGRRPEAVVVSHDSARAYVANRFDDTISVVDLEQRRVFQTIKLGSVREKTAAERGEELFYDGRLSLDGWMSCHSCHTDGHTNGFLNDNLSDKSFGAPKRVLSLLGVRDTLPLAWSGDRHEISAQVRASAQDTMQGRAPSPGQVRDLTAFLKTLDPPPPLDRARETIVADQVQRGQALFGKLGCVQCHAPPRYTTPDVYDVGIRDQRGRTEFNPPSLRGVSQRGPYFHDNRAKSLEEALDKVRHQLPRPLTDSERADLLTFLRSI